MIATSYTIARDGDAWAVITMAGEAVVDVISCPSRGAANREALKLADRGLIGLVAGEVSLWLIRDALRGRR